MMPWCVAEGPQFVRSFSSNWSTDKPQCYGKHEIVRSVPCRRGARRAIPIPCGPAAVLGVRYRARHGIAATRARHAASASHARRCRNAAEHRR